MPTLQIALVSALAVLLLAWLWLRRRTRGGDGDSDRATDRIDTLIGWPPKPTRVLTTQERIAFGTLSRALPEYMILAQVPLARFVSVPKRNSYADWLRRVGYQCVDFVVCDMAAQVVAVIEVQSGQTNERSRKRLARISRTLKAAQIPLQVWVEHNLPAADAARAAILPKPQALPAPLTLPAMPTAAATAAALAPTTMALAPKINPFDDTGRDSKQDEMIELLEPPPSTWFDELDSDPVPLAKR